MPKHKFEKTSYEYGRGERVNWLDQFADSYGKTAVEVSRDRQSLSDQIASIFNNSSPTGHHTVEGVVREYQERTGLNEYLKRVSTEQAQIKNASADVLPNCSPQIKEAVLSYVKNLIDNNHGHSSIPAIQHDVLSTFSHKGITASDILNESFASFVNNYIAEAQGNNPRHTDVPNDLGRGVGIVDADKDEENTDFLSSIMVNL